MPNDRYSNPLTERYASAEMSRIFSPDFKFGTWRRLWLALAEAERELGLPVSQEAIEAIRPELQPAAVTARADVASVAIFGPDFRERPGIAGQMFRSLAGQGVNILAISTSISTINCIIELSRLSDALRAISQQFDLP